MHKSVILSSTREVPLLHFLWKWKMTTTAALIKKFFPNCNGKTAYNRLLSLRHAGLIRVKSDGMGEKFVYALDQKGFDVIRESMPQLKEEGFKSESMSHDLLVSAFHLGNWLIESPKDSILFSEQQLRRYDPEFYPDWVPKSDVHRPDGYSYTLVDGQPATIAFEVELHYKRNADYTRVAEFYSHFRNIHKVLWLVPKEAMASNLEEKLNASSRRTHSPHNFILLEEFGRLGWESEICIGPDQGKTLSNLMMGIVPKSDRNPAVSNLSLALLDLRKSPHTSTNYREYQFGDFAD